MKSWQLILVLFISFIVGFSTNVFYENFKLKGPNEDQEKFTAFLDEYWEYVIDQNPTFASLLGYEGYDDKVSSNSISEFYKNRDFEKYVIDVLETINPESLTEDDQLNYRLLLLSNETDLESRSFPGFYMRLNQRGGVQDYYDLASRLKLESIQDHRNWFERVKSYSQNVKNSLDINREGLEKGYTQPKHIVRKVAEQIDSMTSKKTEENPYFKSFSKLKNITIICGRYEGIDQRVIDKYVDEEISIGDFILSGGEYAAVCLIDAITRHIPGTLGNEDSYLKDTFSNGLLKGDVYAKPESFESMKVPDVLLSGNHKEIDSWREHNSLLKTFIKRPELLNDVKLTKKQKKLLEEWASKDIL